MLVRFLNDAVILRHHSKNFFSLQFEELFCLFYEIHNIVVHLPGNAINMTCSLYKLEKKQEKTANSILSLFFFFINFVV